MKNLCNTCKFSKWDLGCAENAHCNQNPSYKVIGEGNYVEECSSYQSNNVIKSFLNWIKNESN